MEKILLSVLPYCDTRLARSTKRAHGSVEVYRVSRDVALHTLNHLIATRQIERGSIMVGHRSNVIAEFTERDYPTCIFDPSECS